MLVVAMVVLGGIGGRGAGGGEREAGSGKRGAGSGGRGAGGGKREAGSGRPVCFILRLYLRLFAVCFKYLVFCCSKT